MSSDYISTARTREQEDPSSSSFKAEDAPNSESTDSPIQTLNDVSGENHMLLEAASRLNCVILFQNWRDCLVNGPLGERVTLCLSARNRHEACMQRQKQILFEMGYHRALGGTGERLKILNAADKQQREEDVSNGLHDNE
ncbi:hypothetical protein BJ684DRAFT_19325 [Piptocephalis cylindrospora]|uniref:Uncharacterized protein n=1 Tax=Piptocephalis cylindrospora TaxID=1907219 RepID=A0A4P9Y5L0_9FUNG|nr:hypothetical protein BJ684DRAFT_19325 [Piptocephalis cylindrospora]|eukprot:RKP14245.1 hypothetical protein BJ684DRAFT_19325 [Piptocephalis cylindrospora]